MPSSPNPLILVDSGRLPLWFRIMAVVLGLGALYFGLAIAMDGLFGLYIGMPLQSVKGSRVLGALGCLAVAIAWIFTWFAQCQILYKPASNHLGVCTRGFLGWHIRRISLEGATSIHLSRIRSGFSGYKWAMTLKYADGSSESVTSFSIEAEESAAAIASAINLPVHFEGS